MSGDSNGWAISGSTDWHRVIPGVGVLLVVGAVARAGVAVAAGQGLLEAAINLVLLGSPGAVFLYVGRWLPSASIDPECYPRIAGWIGIGVAVMGLVLGLRVLHPGVAVGFTFGTQAVLLSIGSLAGLGIGVREAQALSRARALERQNERLTETERRLEDAVDQLQASNERLEQFAYAASHDLQEPLRTVTSYIDLATDRHGDDLDEECAEFLRIAADGADRMRAMIDGLLEYSRVDTQGDPFDDVDLNAVLDDVLADLEFKLDETDAAVTRDPLPTVDGDERQLRQLFQNLLENAMEYSGDDPPHVHVSATQEGSTWTVSVRDDGIGIDPEHADRIFDVFQRLHSQDEHPGSGIGLALCERIVERHDGTLWVDSESGEGSTFSFTLPEAEDARDSVEAGEIELPAR